MRRVALPLDARVPTRLSAQVDAGRCVDAFIVPSDEVGHVEVTAQDEHGVILGRSQNSGRERYVVLCSPLDATVSLEVRPQSGRGMGVLSVSRTRPGTELDIEGDIVRSEIYPERELEAELGSLEADLASRAGYSRGRRVSTGTLEVGRRASWTLNFPAGCSRLDVVGGRPLRGLEATAWSPSGQLLARAEGSAHATLFLCGAAGPMRVDLEATLRPGPFALVAHDESDVPAPLLASPLAAGRLLSQVVERGVLRKPSEIGQVRELSLSDAELQTIELTVPIGRCVDVALALGSEAAGAEVRLVSIARGSEIAIGRGAHATSARACALDATSAEANLKTRAELRVRAGSGKALVATRMLSPTR